METINFKKPTFKKTKLNNFPRSFKAISPVIATLLMIAIVVVASLVVYAWVNGYIGFQTSKTGKAIDIPSVALASDGLHVYVQNVGQSDVTLGALYVNGEQKDFTPDPNYSNNVLPTGETANIFVDSSYIGSAKLNIKVTTTDGAYMTKTETVKTGSENPNPTNSADNTSPILSAISDQTVDELTQLTFTATATDSDLPANTLTYSLIDAPSDASIDPNSGVFSWTPTEAQGPGDYSFTVRVTDNGSPAMYAEKTVNVHVNEVASTPQSITLRPNGQGHSENLASNPSSYWDWGSWSWIDIHNWENVAETTSDSDSTYVYTDHSTELSDTYAMQNSGIATGAIQSVTVHVMARVSGGSGVAREYIRIGGTDYSNLNTHSLTRDFSEYENAWTTNPKTSAAWTWSDIDSLECGVGLSQSGSSGSARCTQVWVVVSYFP